MKKQPQLDANGNRKFGIRDKIAYAAGDLAPDPEKGVGALDRAVAYLHVLARNANPPSVAVAPRLYDERVVALVEDAVLD